MQDNGGFRIPRHEILPAESQPIDQLIKATGLRGRFHDNMQRVVKIIISVAFYGMLLRDSELFR